MQRYRYLIVGGGVAAAIAAKEFAKRGLERGELALVSADDTLPYDRPALSKGYLLGDKDRADILINEAIFYDDNGIDVRLNTRVTALNAADRTVLTEEGETLAFEKLLIATGCRVRAFNLPGSARNGLYYLRLLADADRIRVHAEEASRALVIGGSFIAMEVAAALARRGLTTTMVFPEERVWQAFFTPEMSAFFTAYYRERGVEIRPGTTVNAFLGAKAIDAVELGGGERLPTDMVVAGIGVVPVTDVFDSSGLQVENGLVVNEYLETNMPDVYAVGDVARYIDVIYGRRRRVEHWDAARVQARRAVRNMTGSRQPHRHVPYFFSDVFDLSWEFWGDTTGADQVVRRGRLDDGSFGVWWLAQERLVAAFLQARPEEERKLAPKWIEDKKQLAAEALSDLGQSLTDLDANQ